MNRVSRAEKMMEKLVDNDLLTEAGKNYIITAVDPFHDTPVDCSGIPDGQSSQNVVQTIKQTITVTTPTGLTAGQTWDCYITMFPWVNFPYIHDIYDGPNDSSFNTTQNYIYDISGGNTQIGGLVAWATPSIAGSGNNASFTALLTQAGSPTTGNTVAQLFLPNAYRYDKRRVVGCGFEVYNTTAQLYKGGSVVVWRSPVPDVEAAQELIYFKTNGTGAVSAASPIQAIVFEAPPPDSANAILLPNSKQWDAEKGCYVVCAMHGDAERNPMSRQWVQPVLTTTPVVQGVPTPRLEGPLLVGGPTPIGSAPIYYFNDCEWHHGDMSGAYFTGLAQGSTLTINYNIILEKFPGLDDVNLTVLSRPPPLQDDNALELYSRIVQQLPVGVPVDQNGFGDWFAGIVNTAKEYIAPVLSMIPHPVAQGASKLIQGASSLVNRNDASEQLNARSKVERRQRKRRGKALM